MLRVSNSSVRLAFACALGLLLAPSAFGCATASATSASDAASSRDPLTQIDGEQLYAEGTALAQHGDYVRAEQYLAASMRRGVPAARVLPLLLRVCLVSSRLGAAFQHANPQLELQPGDVQLRYLVASLLTGLGRHDEARVELLRVLRDVPDHAGARYALGVLLRDHYRDAEASVPHFQRYLELDPDGLHGAEIAAFLREHAAKSAWLALAPPASRAPESASTPASLPATDAPAPAPVLVPMPARAPLPEVAP
jgi:tetratricopeptide (TPR) repeat protein